MIGVSTATFGGGSWRQPLEAAARSALAVATGLGFRWLTLVGAVSRQLLKAAARFGLAWVVVREIWIGEVAQNSVFWLCQKTPFFEYNLNTIASLNKNPL